MSIEELKLQEARCRIQCPGHHARKYWTWKSVISLTDWCALCKQIRSSIFRNDLKIIEDWKTNLNSFAQDLEIKDKNWKIELYVLVIFRCRFFRKMIELIQRDSHTAQTFPLLYKQQGCLRKSPSLRLKSCFKCFCDLSDLWATLVLL